MKKRSVRTPSDAAGWLERGRTLLLRCVPKLLQGSELRSDIEHFLSDSQRCGGVAASTKVAPSATTPVACVACTHHSFERVLRREEYRYIHHCEHPALRDVVTGAHTPCDSNRRSEAKCGIEARYFALKAKR